MHDIHSDFDNHTFYKKEEGTFRSVLNTKSGSHLARRCVPAPGILFNIIDGNVCPYAMVPAIVYVATLLDCNQSINQSINHQSFHITFHSTLSKIFYKLTTKCEININYVQYSILSIVSHILRMQFSIQLTFILPHVSFLVPLINWW